MLTVAPHPLLDLAAFVTVFPEALGQRTSSTRLLELLSAAEPAPMQSSDEIRRAVRDLLRHGGFKPTGRNKPASEYLIKAAGGATLTSINPAVDACNVASLHSGLPISVVDLEKAQAPLRIAVAEQATSYVFNPSGQTIDIGGLLCLFDAQGPCAGPVKDSQRTKTSPDTRRTLSVIWGTISLAGRAAETAAWYQRILGEQGAEIESI